MTRLVAIGLTCALLAAPACDSDSEELRLPTGPEIEDLYGSAAEVSLNGNVIDVRVVQGDRQLRRGGALWAKVGPYIYLFSPQTQDVFGEYGGVAAVRVRTFTESGERIAGAMLRRDALNSITWRDARRLIGRARTEGTEKPGYLEDLVSYGEDHTSYEYNPEYVEQS